MPFHEHSVEALLLRQQVKKITQKYSRRLFLEYGQALGDGGSALPVIGDFEPMR